MIWFVCRHPGATAWAREQGLAWGKTVIHLRAEDVASGDEVYGVLPGHIAAAVCAKGALYWHLALDLPESLRGCEASLQDMSTHGARFVRLHVQELAQ
jgi:CRISPR-associated protein Csx16